MDIDGIVKKALSRRTFLAGAGSAAAATLVAGCSDNGTVTLPATSVAYNDVDILNFALNLEYLEAEFYLRAATGSGLATTDIGSGTSTTGTGAGTVNGGTKIVAALTTFQTAFVNELAYTEQQHVRALRAALGTAAVARPTIDLTAGFAGGVTAANSLFATSTTLPAIPTTFSPFADYNSFLVGAFLFEDVGVTAYNGAAPLISTAGIAAGYLAAAAGIMSIEAYHGAAIRTQLTANTIINGTTTYPYALYANRLSMLRASLGGGNETQLGNFATGAQTVATVAASSIVPVDANALAYHRTTDQVLHIAYGTFSPTAGATTPAAGVKGGGFLPNGATGNISVTQS